MVEVLGEERGLGRSQGKERDPFLKMAPARKGTERGREETIPEIAARTENVSSVCCYSSSPVCAMTINSTVLLICYYYLFSGELSEEDREQASSAEGGRRVSLQLHV